MNGEDDSIVESLLAVTEELTPLNSPEPGELLIAKWRHRNPSESLLQERNGIWYQRDLTVAGAEWEPIAYYVQWFEIWKKFTPIHRIKPKDAPIEDLEEMLEIISWVPAADI